MTTGLMVMSSYTNLSRVKTDERLNHSFFVWRWGLPLGWYTPHKSAPRSWGQNKRSFLSVRNHNFPCHILECHTNRYGRTYTPARSIHSPKHKFKKTTYSLGGGKATIWKRKHYNPKTRAATPKRHGGATHTLAHRVSHTQDLILINDSKRLYLEFWWRRSWKRERKRGKEREWLSYSREDYKNGSVYVWACAMRPPRVVHRPLMRPVKVGQDCHHHSEPRQDNTYTITGQTELSRYRQTPMVQPVRPGL